MAAQPGINRFDFRGYPNLSYGYQMPFGMHGKPRTAWIRQPLADKGPAFAVGGETGGNLDNLQHTLKRKLGEWRAREANRTTPTSGLNKTTEESLLQLGPEIRAL